MRVAFDRSRIHALLEQLNLQLARVQVRGEVYLLGGAVMCLVYNARESTQDLDALFVPSAELRAAAQRVASSEGVPEDWLNDAAKGYLSQAGEFVPFVEFSHLSVSTATPEYLLAMKCLAMRLGFEFHDEADIRYLLRHLNIASYSDALEVLQRFYPLEHFPQKTLYALQEILE